MAKKVKNEESTTEELVQKLDRTALNMELFLEKNAKAIGIVIGIVVLAALGYFASVSYTHLTLPTTPYV